MSRASIRYAKAILSLAVDQNAAEKVSDDMKLIAKTISENTELESALKNAIAKQDAKRKILEGVFPKTNALTAKLFDLLVENNRIDIVGDVAKNFNTLYFIKVIYNWKKHGLIFQ